MCEKKRIIWIDQLKCIAFIFVIIGHLPIPGTFKSWIYSFHMPLFFFSTGLTMNYEKINRTPFKDYFLTHTKRMLIPYVWMQMLSFCLRQAAVMVKHKGEVPVKTYLLGIITGNNNLVGAPSNPLYYVLVLFIAEIVIWAIVKLCKANKTWITLCSVLLLPVGLFFTKVDMVWHINCVPVAVFFIIVGNLLMDLYKANREKLENLNAFLYIALILSLFAFGFVCWKYNGRFSLHGNYYGEEFIIAALAAVFTGTSIALCVMKLPSMKLVTFIGQNTLFYMGIHKPLLLVFEAMFPQYTKNALFIIAATIVCALVLVPATLLGKKLFPFALGQFTETPNKLQKAGQLVALLLSLLVPYNYFLNHWNGGILKSTPLYTVLSLLVFIAITTVFWALTSKFIPVIYLCSKEKRTPSQIKA